MASDESCDFGEGVTGILVMISVMEKQEPCGRISDKALMFLTVSNICLCLRGHPLPSEANSTKGNAKENVGRRFRDSSLSNIQGE